MLRRDFESKHNEAARDRVLNEKGICYGSL